MPKFKHFECFLNIVNYSGIDFKAEENHGGTREVKKMRF